MMILSMSAFSVRREVLAVLGANGLNMSELIYQC
jgi:hypothetical protein